MTASPSAAPTNVRYIVLAALCVATIIAYIDRGSVQVASVPIRGELGLDDDQLDWLLGSFFMTYAIFQLPGGWLGTVWGNRKSLAFFCALWSVATGICGLAFGFPLLLFGRFAMGAAEAGIFPCATSTLARWFPASRRAFASGLMAGCMGVGGFLGGNLTTLLLLGMAWRSVFLLYMLPGLAWAAWFYWWFRDRPGEHPSVNAAEVALIRGPLEDVEAKLVPPTEPTPWARILSSRAMWCINIAQFFKAGAVGFYQTKFMGFLMEARGADFKFAGFIVGIPLIALAVGAPVGGIISDWILYRTGSRRLARQGLTFASLFVAALFCMAALLSADALLTTALLTIGSFCASLSNGVAYAITIDMGGKHVVPVFVSMNMFGNLGTASFPFAAGAIVQLLGWPFVPLFVAALFVCAGILWLPFNADGSIAEGAVRS